MKYTHNKEPYNEMSFDLKQLKDPKNEFYPYFSWIWCTPIEKGEIMRQLDQYAENNVKNLYIIPEPQSFRPDSMPTTLEPDYLTKEYFEIYRFACEYAAEKGIGQWIYDEGGWPSGSACGKVIEKKPHLMSKTLAEREVSSPYVPGENAVAGYYNGKRIEPGFKCNAAITEYYFKPNPGYYPNMSEAEATDTFIELTHEQYKKYMRHMFGKNVTAAFTDEPSTSRTGWCDGFPEKFKERYGYDLLDHLPTIMAQREDDVDTAEQKVRIDYTDLLAEVFAENYFLKLRTWCNKNNLMSTGHLNGEDETLHRHQGYHSVLRQLRCFDIPGIDVIWRQIFPGQENHFFPRFASSAANQIGAPYTMTETYSIYGAGLTFEQMRYVLFYQLTRGINKFNVMLIPYSCDGIERRGARPGFTPHMPTWRHLKSFNKYSARLSYLSSLGLPGIECAVYMPMRDFWAGGERAKTFAQHFDAIVRTLEKAHCPVDLIDDDFLETASLCANKLCTGTAAYSMVVLQREADLPEKSKQMLDEFVRAGGKIIYDDELEKAQPAANITNENIAVFKRNLENGTLYVLHNESTNDEKFSVSFFEKGNVYEIKAQSGELYTPELEDVLVKSGEERIYLITNSRFDAKTPQKHTQGELIIENMEMKRSFEFKIGDFTFEKQVFDEEFAPATLGDWCDIYGKDFSGEVIYRAEFDFDSVPESIEIDLGDVRYSCDVTLNGVPLKTLCFAPFICTAEGALIKKHNTLLIRVANTPANQYVAATFFDDIPQNIIGPYHRIAKQFESESLPSGLMNFVKIRF